MGRGTPRAAPRGPWEGQRHFPPFPSRGPESRASLDVSLSVPAADLYCTLEVDSFGYFVSKAKTRVFRDTTEPKWDEVSGGVVSPPGPLSSSPAVPTPSPCSLPVGWGWPSLLVLRILSLQPLCFPLPAHLVSDTVYV